MDNKSYGLILMVFGFILLIISLLTIWSLFVNFDLSNALLIVLSIPLFIFSISSITLAIIMVSQKSINIKLKGLLLVINGIVSILAALYTMLDFRLSGLGLINLIVLLPMLLVGVFFIIDGVILFIDEKYLQGIKSKKKASQILGIVSISVGIINLIAFILLFTINPNQPIILIAFWAFLSVILIFFGVITIMAKTKKT
ncbi:MAG: hypothetical protein ACFFD1_13835 [Candidatus Thorarchaeota archaeon]